MQGFAILVAIVHCCRQSDYQDTISLFLNDHFSQQDFATRRNASEMSSADDGAGCWRSGPIISLQFPHLVAFTVVWTCDVDTSVQLPSKIHNCSPANNEYYEAKSCTLFSSDSLNEIPCFPSQTTKRFLLHHLFLGWSSNRSYAIGKQRRWHTATHQHSLQILL